MTIDETVQFFKDDGVVCKKVEDNRPDCKDFIAIFKYGNLTRSKIVKTIKENDLLRMFFEGTPQRK